MARAKRFTLVAGVAIVFVLLAVVTIFRAHNSRRLKLPAGPITPAVGLADNYGLILAPDGSIWSWGLEFPSLGVLGLGTVSNQFPLRRIGSETNWVQIAPGGYHCLALKSDGTMWTWGSNLRLLLFGNTNYSGPPARTWSNIPVPAAPGHDWARIANGGDHNLALKKNGTLWAWGINWCGQLGNGTRTDSAVPVQVGSATNWTKIWAGTWQSVGQQSDGSLWVWGDNPAFAMGTNALLTPTRLSADTNWVDVAMGTYTTFGLKADGTLWVWGRAAKAFEEPRDKSLDAAYTQAGSSTNWSAHFFENMASTVPLRVGTNSDWKAVVGSEWWYLLLLKKDGSLWALDATEYDDIGKPPSQYRPLRPWKIGLQKDIASIAAGHEGGLAPTDARFRVAGVVITRDGEVWTWGNALGEAKPDRLREFMTAVAHRLHIKTTPQPQVSLSLKPVYRDQPWLLPNIDPDAMPSK